MFLIIFICNTVQINHFVTYKNDSFEETQISFRRSRLFQETPFYNKHIGKPKIKRLKNIDFLSEIPFYKDLNVLKTNHSFKGYAMSYKVEIIERKDPINQLEPNKSSSKGFFSDFLNETKGFNY